MSKDIRIEQIMTEKVIVANLNSKFSQIMDFFQSVQYSAPSGSRR